MPRKQRKPKKRNLEKIRRKREERKLHKHMALAEAGYPDMQQASISHQAQAELVGRHEMPGYAIVQDDVEHDLWHAVDANGMHARTWQLGDVIRKFRWWTGRDMSKHELVQEVQWHLELHKTMNEARALLSSLWGLSSAAPEADAVAH